MRVGEEYQAVVPEYYPSKFNFSLRCIFQCLYYSFPCYLCVAKENLHMKVTKKFNKHSNHKLSDRLIVSLIFYGNQEFLKPQIFPFLAMHAYV